MTSPYSIATRNNKAAKIKDAAGKLSLIEHLINLRTHLAFASLVVSWRSVLFVEMLLAAPSEARLSALPGLKKLLLGARVRPSGTRAELPAESTPVEELLRARRFSANALWSPSERGAAPP